MKHVLIALLPVLLLACGRAERNARSKAEDLGLRADEATCVYRSAHLAYCLVGRFPYICDDTECLPVTCGTALEPVLELDRGKRE